jgi:hypothetical protein
MQYTARMHRRTFLETSIVTSCLSALHVSLFVPEQRIDQVGLQLYTVRDLMKSDFEDSLVKSRRSWLYGGRIRRILQ